MATSKWDLNQPIWESSQRLLHPKCIQNGAYRHFIFDQDLTNAYRSRCDQESLNAHVNHSSARIEKSLSFGTVEPKLDGLRIIGAASDRIQNTQSLTSLSERSDLNEDIRFDNDFECYTFNSCEIAETMTPPNDSTDENSMLKGMKQINNEIDSSKNLLAERVLQWLDLAGGRDHLLNQQNEHNVKLLNGTAKRRSLTAKEQRKNSNELQNDAVTAVKLLRREPLHQMSMTFHEMLTVEDTAASPRNLFRDIFGTTYKYSRKFLALRRPKNAIDTLEPLDLQLSMPIKALDAKSKPHKSNKPRRLLYCDDQYRALIQREILEKTINTQAAKRQLHIFMPNVPKRCLIVQNDGDDAKNIETTDNTDNTPLISSITTTQSGR